MATPEARKKMSVVIDLRKCWTMVTRPFRGILDRLEIRSVDPMLWLFKAE
jgi:hypothetical protein